MKKEAKFWKKLKDNKIQCNLCNHKCIIDKDKFGICNVRKNEEGKLFTMIYNSCSSIAIDPIEKKPFFHFYPGSSVLSLGSVGCNLKCDHCQNYGISTADINYSNLQEIYPQKVIDLALERGCAGIAWTYNEPSIWHEYAYDTAKIAKKSDLYTVYVSNGFISEEPLKELSSVIDAMNIDVKAFNDNFYKRYCKARLEPVLNTCLLAKEMGMHIELTYLIIPTLNDSDEEISNFCKWVVDKLGVEVCIHFSRFHPDYKMKNLKITPMETMLKAYNIAKNNGVLYTYLGNVPSGSYENTLCPKCGNICIERYGYSIILSGLKSNKCSKCGFELPIVF